MASRGFRLLGRLPRVPTLAGAVAVLRLDQENHLAGCAPKRGLDQPEPGSRALARRGAAQSDTLAAVIERAPPEVAEVAACPPLLARPQYGPEEMPEEKLALIKAELRIVPMDLLGLVPGIQDEMSRLYEEPTGRHQRQLWADPTHLLGGFKGAALHGALQRAVMFNDATMRIWHAMGFPQHALLAASFHFLQEYNVEELREGWPALYKDAKEIAGAMANDGVAVHNWTRNRPTGRGVVVKYHHWWPTSDPRAMSAFHFDSPALKMRAPNWRFGQLLSSDVPGSSCGYLQFKSLAASPLAKEEEEPDEETESDGENESDKSSKACVGTEIVAGKMWAMGPNVRASLLNHNRWSGATPNHNGVMMLEARTFTDPDGADAGARTVQAVREYAAHMLKALQKHKYQPEKMRRSDVACDWWSLATAEGGGVTSHRDEGASTALLTSLPATDLSAVVKRCVVPDCCRHTYAPTNTCPHLVTLTGADCQGMSVDKIAAKLGLTDTTALGSNGILSRLAHRGITETADWHGAGHKINGQERTIDYNIIKDANIDFCTMTGRDSKNCVPWLPKETLRRYKLFEE